MNGDRTMEALHHKMCPMDQIRASSGLESADILGSHLQKQGHMERGVPTALERKYYQVLTT